MLQFFSVGWKKDKICVDIFQLLFLHFHLFLNAEVWQRVYNVFSCCFR